MSESIKISFISLGCDKNLVDSEKMLGMLSESGCEFVDELSEATVCVVNSCCFINDAKEESIERILEAAKYKTDGSLNCLIVTGCLAQRYSKEIREEIPEVDAIIGTNAYDKIYEVIQKTIGGERPDCIKDFEGLPCTTGVKRVVTTGGHFAYLKIAEGCAKHCTYCIIPTVRGGYRSVPMDEIIKEAKQLVEGGVKELILVAQETTMYGHDIYGKKMLPKLLEELSLIEGLIWIRILYCYPEEITDELISVMAANKKICNYLDIPIQHCNDDILKKMGRRTTKAEITMLIGKLRKAMPDIALRTTFITGFPGETEENFQELAEFINEIEFDRLGVFTYSPEEGTKAATFLNQIEEDTKKKRRDELMELQQEISYDNGQKMIGKTLQVMIEGKLPDEHAYVGRTYKDAPDVDGLIFVQTPLELMSGDIVDAKVTGALEYDLIGEIKDEFTE